MYAPDVTAGLASWERHESAWASQQERIAETAAELGQDLLAAILDGTDRQIHDPYPDQWKRGWSVSDEVADSLADTKGHAMHASIARLIALVATGDTLSPSDRIAAQAIVAHIRVGYEAKCIDALENRE